MQPSGCYYVTHPLLLVDPPHKGIILYLLFQYQTLLSYLQIINILKSLETISNDLTKAIKYIGSDLSIAHNICENIKDERRKMRKEEWQMLNRLYNYDMDYLSRTFLYLKELIENIMMLADHIKSFSEYIQFLAIKYLIFD